MSAIDASMGDPLPMIKELHGDLRRKYELHGPKIEQLWQSFDKAQRIKARKAGAKDNIVLQDPSDRSMEASTK
jgi:hypothetical protein